MKKYIISSALVLLFSVGGGMAYAENKINDSSSHAVVGESHAAVCVPGSKSEIHCHARVIVDQAGVPKVATLPAGLGPVDFHNAYGSVATVSGQQIIAIVDAYDHPTILSDLNAYSATFGIPSLPQCSGPVLSSLAPCFQKVNQLGGASYPSVNAGWALEISLDVEAAHAMCQNCSILLVEAKSSSYADLMAAVDRAVALGATVISNSYGSGEFSGETSYDSHFNKTGVAFTFSSGDGGYGVEYPASSQYVTAVGGTSLTFNSNGTYQNETVWDGAGSGCSAYEGKPFWQTDLGCADHRTVADVSAVADPNTGAAVYDSVRYQGRKGWFKVGGTSLSAPLIAGVYALAGGVPAGVLGSSLPYGNPSNLHDILIGSNGTCGGSYLCTAGIGYDGPTGLGTPNGTLAF